MKIKISFAVKILLALPKRKWLAFEMKRHTGDASQWNLMEHIVKFMQKQGSLQIALCFRIF